MTAPNHAREESGRRHHASKVGTPLRTLGLCLASLAVMAPWPLLGIALMHPYQPVAKVIRAADEQKAESQRRRNSLVSQGILLRCGSLIFGLLLVLAFRSTFATGCYFDRASEAVGFFGGITLFFLMPLAFFSVADEVYLSLMLIVWIAMALIPDLAVRRHLTSWWAVIGLLGIQTAFSFAQAVMGALLIIGKSV